jgi:hypothetical protein
VLKGTDDGCTVRRISAGEIEAAVMDQVRESWLGKFGQFDKWLSCLTAAMLPQIRSEHDEADTTDAQPGFQGEGGAGGDQGRENAGGTCQAV